MRIKRFIAPDMRTALRMVRDEQGPDAVILSNRATADGIEVVAALDYDESLVTQALRAAAPGLEPTLTSSAGAPTPAPTAAAMAAPQFISMPVAAEATAAPARSVASIATARPSRQAEPRPVVHMSAQTAVAEAFAAPRESLMSRARAIFKIGDGPDAPIDGPTLAELTAATQNITTAKVSPTAANPNENDEAAQDSTTVVPTASRFDAMMAAFNPPAGNFAAQEPAVENTMAADAAVASTATAARIETSDADYLISLASMSADISTPPVVATVSRDAAVSASAGSAPMGALQAIANTSAEASDPTIIAMRRELATMRELMEKQMEQLSLERLRGAPARAAVFETLKGYGCDEKLAQTVAAAIDPRLEPSQIREPMFAELMRMLTIARNEPIEDGGVIALVGPTGAGKTTTAAKLAARFAARHRARDVALVSIDRERTGAREQLHAHGRRLGVTVCDADNSDALDRALEQLVDYPLVLVDTAGYGVRDRALLRQILWLRSASRVRSLLVLPANAHPHDLGEIVRRYRPAAPEGVVLTKLDETGRLGAALSVLAHHGIPLTYTTAGQQVPADLDTAAATHLVEALEKTPGAADNPFATEERHALV